MKDKKGGEANAHLDKLYQDLADRILLTIAIIRIFAVIKKKKMIMKKKVQFKPTVSPDNGLRLTGCYIVTDMLKFEKEFGHLRKITKYGEKNVTIRV